MILQWMRNRTISRWLGRANIFMAGFAGGIWFAYWIAS